MAVPALVSLLIEMRYNADMAGVEPSGAVYAGHEMLNEFAAWYEARAIEPMAMDWHLVGFEFLGLMVLPQPTQKPA